MVAHCLGCFGQEGMGYFDWLFQAFNFECLMPILKIDFGHKMYD